MKRTFRIEPTTDGTWAVRIWMEIPRRHEVKIETIGFCDSIEQAEALALVMRDCRNPAALPKPTRREE